MARLSPGDTAPPFALASQDGGIVSLADFAGRKLLVYFYPRADTPGCTRQACSVRDARPNLDALGIDAVGISPDMPDAQQKFDTRYGLSFPLLSDPDHAVAESYGVWGEKTRFGKKSMGINRSAFLVGEAGAIIGAWYNVKPEDTIPKALAALESA